MSMKVIKKGNINLVRPNVKPPTILFLLNCRCKGNYLARFKGSKLHQSLVFITYYATDGRGEGGADPM
jgi:hypothetical protein